MHANECLNKMQKPIYYSVNSVPRKEDKDYEIEEDTDSDVTYWLQETDTSSSKALQYSKRGNLYSCT